MNPFTCPKCGGTTGLGHLCIETTPEIQKCDPPTKNGYFWIRHVNPLRGSWQPVMVQKYSDCLRFCKFGWSGSMDVSAAEELGLEWGPECIPPS